ncbi:unnamed protein product [Durusdinium trenchii]|uniref:C3H1-type domain-containing protein n=1 Tax=Durusdinium trenchii TaxID=1381693 RepID=A0ABP0QKP5_9DINO
MGYTRYTPGPGAATGRVAAGHAAAAAAGAAETDWKRIADVVKPLAVLGSDFQEVLLLDADNLPAVDPSFLFDEPQYRATGALFWPDLSPFEEKMPEQWLALSAGHWLSRPCNLRWEQESGQLLVDKDRCAAPIRRAASMALHLRELSAYLPGDGGDKDLFQIAWRLEGHDFGMCPLPAAAGRLQPECSGTVHGPFVGETMVHHSSKGLPCFLHRTIDKHEDMWELHWEVIARPLKETQCLCLQRICPDAKVKARMVPTRAADVEVLPFDHVVVGDLRTRFARIVAELRTAGDPKGSSAASGLAADAGAGPVPQPPPVPALCGHHSAGIFHLCRGRCRHFANGRCQRPWSCKFCHAW